MKKQIRLTAYSAVLSAILAALVLVGSVADMLDLVVVSIASLVLYIVCAEMGCGRALMIFAVSGTLGFILAPMTSTSLFYVCFFGYYPILRAFLERKKLSKKLLFWLLLAVYVVAMGTLFLVFKQIFLADAGEPVWVNWALAVTSIIYYLVFQRLMRVMLLLYELKFKKMLFGNKKKEHTPKESDYDISKRDF